MAQIPSQPKFSKTIAANNLSGTNSAIDAKADQKSESSAGAIQWARLQQHQQDFLDWLNNHDDPASARLWKGIC